MTEDETFLHTYNCNWEAFPRKNDLSHRRKQVCRRIVYTCLCIYALSHVHFVNIMSLCFDLLCSALLCSALPCFPLFTSSQMYRADYVKLHYVHYSTVTVVSQMTEKETRSASESWLHRYVERHTHEFDEEKEATMLHTKTKVARNMLSWGTRCKQSSLVEGYCHIGFPFPLIANKADTTNKMRDDGWAYNCFLNEKIENYWWPKLVEAVKKRKELTMSK